MLKNTENGVIILVTIVILVGINLLSNSVYHRFDLTEDGRYTLSNTSEAIIESAESPLIIDIFLEGDLPSEFRLLQTEIKQLIEEFQSINPRIRVNYIDPLKDESNREQIIQELTRSGLEPYVNSQQNSGKVTQELIFPWGFASYGNETVKIPFLKKSLTSDLQAQIANSIQHLEYAFADAFNKILKPKTKKIAVLKGNGQLDDIYIADFLTTVKEIYNIGAFTLDSVASNPLGTLQKLKEFDLIISAKPTQPFTENEKLVLDQFALDGGKSLWLLESIIMEKDSLMNAKGSSVSTARELNLNDFFFKYGVRVNQNLVKDLYSAPIALAFGEGANSQFQPVQWQYSPLGTANPNHPISNNLDIIKFDFTSQIDTLKNRISKTVLVQSSDKTQLIGPLKPISLPGPNQDLNEANYTSGIQNLAVLLEGEFSSVYEKRILPFKLNSFKSKGVASKMVVIADGDVIKNEVSRNRPMQLGFDRLTGRSYGNKEFLLNTVNYLLDDSGLINIRSKDVNVAFLDTERIEDEKAKWQFINIIVPLLLLTAFGFIFNYLRKRKYT